MQPFYRPQRRPASLLGDDASIRSRTWVGKFRGRRHLKQNPSIATDEPAFMQALVTDSEEDATLATPTGFRDELKEETFVAAGVPKPRKSGS